MDFIDVSSLLGASAPGVNPFLILRVLRAARLIKLIRLLKYQRVYNRLVARISISNGTLTKIQATVGVILISHWFACIFAMVATLHPDPTTTYWYTRGFFCAEAANSTLGVMETCGLGVAEWYIACLTWAILVVTGTGGTDEFPTSSSMPENVVVTIINLIAALFWTTVLATFCDVTASANPEESEFQQTMDELNMFMANHSLPETMKRRLREYFQQRKHVRREQRAFAVTQQMSSALQTEVTLYAYGSWLRQIPFLRGCESDLLVQVAMSMQPVVFAPSETCPRAHLYVIQSGLVAYGPKLLGSGKIWGEEIITDTLVEQYTARCLTYVEGFTLSRKSFRDILQNFDASKIIVRRSAVRLVLRRGATRVGREARSIRNGAPRKDFISRMLNSSVASTDVGSTDNRSSVREPPPISLPTALDPASELNPVLTRRIDGMESELRGLRSDVQQMLQLLSSPATVIKLLSSSRDASLPTSPVKASSSSQTLLRARHRVRADLQRAEREALGRIHASTDSRRGPARGERTNDDSASYSDNSQQAQVNPTSGEVPVAQEAARGPAPAPAPAPVPAPIPLRSSTRPVRRRRKSDPMSDHTAPF